MAITSLGYDGTVDETAWSKYSPHLGGPPCRVSGASPTIRTGVVGGVRVPAGVYAGSGIVDTLAGNTDVATTTTTAVARWDSVVLRRNWATNTTTVAVVAGGATRGPAPSGLNTTPGVLEDQVICLVRMAAGQSDVQEVVPWTPWASSVMSWPITDLPPAAAYTEGQVMVAAGGEIVVRRLSGATPVWQSLTDPPWTDLTSFGAGWKERSLYQCRARLINGWVEVQGAVQATMAYPYYAALYLPGPMHPTAPRLMGAHQASDRGPSYELTAESSGQITIARDEWVNPTTAYPVGMTFPISGRFPIATPTT